MIEEHNINDSEIIKLYKRIENLRKTQKKYQQTHKNKISEISRTYYLKNKDNPEYLEKKKMKANIYYELNKEKIKQRKKEQYNIIKQNKKEDKEITRT